MARAGSHADRGKPGDDRAARRLYAGSLLLFLCALFSKTSTTVLPAAILLDVWWKRGRITRDDARPVLPFFALAIAAGLLTTWVESHHVGATGER